MSGTDGDAAERAYEQAYDAYQAGDLRRAARLLERAIAAGTRTPALYKLQAYTAGHRKDNAATLKAADAALALDPEDGEAWELRGNAHYFLHQRERALADYQRALELDYRSTGFYRNYLHTLNELRQHDRLLSVYAQFLQRQREDPQRLPAQSDIPFYASSAYYARNDYPRTIELLGEAIALSPQHAGYYHNRGAAYSAAGQHALALADYANAIRLAPRDASHYYNRGVTWLSQKDYARALEDFSKAHTLGQDDSDLWLNTGVARERLDQGRLALQAYDRALRLNPDNALARGNRATLLAERGKTKAAERDHAKALATLPDEQAGMLRFNDALARQRAGDWAGAIPLLQEAVRLKPDFEQAWSNLGTAHAHLGRRQEALELFNDVIARYPQSGVTLVNRARLLDQMGDTAAARRDYQRAQQLAPTDADIMTRLALHYANAGDRNNAQAWYERARRASPDEPDVYINYSALLLKHNDLRQALVVAREGARAFPSSPALQVNLANALAEAGETKEAISAYRRAIDLRPDDPGAYYNLGNLYALDLKQPGRGVEWYRRALQQRPDPELDAAEQREQRSSIQLNLASAQEMDGDRAGALATLQASIDEVPDNYRPWFNRAGFLLDSGDQAGARRDFAAALERMQRLQAAQPVGAGDDPELLEYSGYAQFHLGQNADAVRSLQRALQQRPDNVTARRNLGYVFLDLDRTSEALTEFQQTFASEPDEIDGWLGLLACTALTGDRHGLARLKQQFEKRYAKRYVLSAGLPAQLAKEGYWYSDRFVQLWARVMAVG